METRSIGYVSELDSKVTGGVDAVTRSARSSVNRKFRIVVVIAGTSTGWRRVVSLSELHAK